jgi:glycosyltransferase involved in cell wall biosynthesis
MPVVASSVAQRGLQAEASKHLHVEDDPAMFASRVVRLLRSPEERVAMGRRARAFVEANHAWDASGARLDTMIRSLAGPVRAAVSTPA